MDERVINMTRELGGITEKLVSINDKIEENHLVHVDNRKDIIQIKEEVKEVSNRVGIQNGRVLKVETKTEEIIKTQDQLAIIVSHLNGELKKRIDREEKWYLFKTTLKQGVVSKAVYIVIGVVAFALLQLLLPNLEVANLLKLI